MLIDTLIEYNSNSKLQERYLQECHLDDLSHEDLLKVTNNLSLFSDSIQVYSQFQLLIPVANHCRVQMAIVYTRCKQKKHLTTFNFSKLLCKDEIVSKGCRGSVLTNQAHGQSMNVHLHLICSVYFISE